MDHISYMSYLIFYISYLYCDFGEINNFCNIKYSCLIYVPNSGLDKITLVPPSTARASTRVFKNILFVNYKSFVIF